MMDLPPPQQPTTIEVQKMNQKQDLLKKIRAMCEATKGITEPIPVNLPMRAYFLDVCNAANSEEIFSFKNANWLLDGCRDGLEVRYMQDCGINPEFEKYHITTDEIFELIHLIAGSGKGESTIYNKMPAEDCSNYAFRAIYTIMKDFPDFNPQFTTFTFGGTMADMPPLRDKDGNPNMDFFRAWKDKTEAYYSRK